MNRKITFSKMDQDTFNGTGTITIFYGNQRSGVIEKESDAEDVGILEPVYKYRAASYEVSLWSPDDPADDDYDDYRTFEVRDYEGGARAALAAAKQWARERHTK